MLQQVIWKFPLKLTGIQEIKLPNVHKILHVGEQDGNLMLWIQLYSDHPFDSSKIIHIIGTGHPVPENTAHLGTVQVGYYVWHVFVELGTG